MAAKSSNAIGKIVIPEFFGEDIEDELLVIEHDLSPKFILIEDVVGSDDRDIIEYVEMSVQEKLMNRLKNNTRNRDHKINRKSSPSCDCQILVISNNTGEIGVECQRFIGAASICDGEIIYSESTGSEDINVNVKEELCVYAEPKKCGLKKQAKLGRYGTKECGIKTTKQIFYIINRTGAFPKENLKTMPMAKLQRLSRAEIREYLGKP